MHASWSWKEYNEGMVSIELGEVITNTVTVIVSYCLREPLCELTDPVLIYEG